MTEETWAATASRTCGQYLIQDLGFKVRAHTALSSSTANFVAAGKILFCTSAREERSHSQSRVCTATRRGPGWPDLKSHVTRHTSHITNHTSHVTRHKSQITRHTSHITHHKSHITRHKSHVTHHTSHITNHTSHITNHSSHATHLKKKRRSRQLQPTSASPPALHGVSTHTMCTARHS